MPRREGRSCWSRSARPSRRRVVVVAGTVLLGVPSGASVCSVEDPSSTLQPAANIEMHTATHAIRFIAPNGRSLMAGWRTMLALRNAIIAVCLVAGCSASAGASDADNAGDGAGHHHDAGRRPRRPRLDRRPTTTRPRLPARAVYVFPFTGKKVSYGHRHHDYPATDVFGCGADVVAPIGGTIEETRTIDPWVPKTDDPATRGGKYVSMLGDDRRALLLRPPRIRCGAAWRCRRSAATRSA